MSPSHYKVMSCQTYIDQSGVRYKDLNFVNRHAWFFKTHMGNMFPKTEFFTLRYFLFPLSDVFLMPAVLLLALM